MKCLLLGEELGNQFTQPGIFPFPATDEDGETPPSAHYSVKGAYCNTLTAELAVRHVNHGETILHLDCFSLANRYTKLAAVAVAGIHLGLNDAVKTYVI